MPSCCNIHRTFARVHRRTIHILLRRAVFLVLQRRAQREASRRSLQILRAACRRPRPPQSEPTLAWLHDRAQSRKPRCGAQGVAPTRGARRNHNRRTGHRRDTAGVVHRPTHGGIPPKKHFFTTLRQHQSGISHRQWGPAGGTGRCRATHRPEHRAARIRQSITTLTWLLRKYWGHTPCRHGGVAARRRKGGLTVAKLSRNIRYDIGTAARPSARTECVDGGKQILMGLTYWCARVLAQGNEHMMQSRGRAHVSAWGEWYASSAQGRCGRGAGRRAGEMGT